MLGFRRVSDEEFVERQRKWLRVRKWFGWLSLVLLGLGCYVALGQYRMLLSVAEHMSDGERTCYDLGLVLGATSAQVAVILGGGAITNFVWGFGLFRSSRGMELLVKYHDTLKKQPHDDPGTGDSAVNP